MLKAFQIHIIFNSYASCTLNHAYAQKVKYNPGEYEVATYGDVGE